MVEDAEALIAGGVRAIWLPVGEPPAGTSPGAEQLDPFWSLLADAAVPVVMHIGRDLNFFRSTGWKHGVEAFKMSPGSDLELPLDPWTFTNVHIAPQNFLASMLLGGVFERHPTLRCGAIEFGGHWVGPLAEMCDMWADQFYRRLTGVISMKPSQYMRRNFRATVFNFEPIDVYLERYGIPEVYCFATDFPHVEGGTSPLEDLAERLDAIDDSTFEDFFVHNGELLLPG
jgi:predicted TIM-barrel fold metal-dependent hydrolase